jgi:hypothetical protein
MGLGDDDPKTPYLYECSRGRANGWIATLHRNWPAEVLGTAKHPGKSKRVKVYFGQVRWPSDDEIEHEVGQAILRDKDKG